LRKLVCLRFASRHPFTWCDGIRRRPRWWISASRYPRLFVRAPRGARLPRRARCSSPTSATDSRHVHLDGPADSRGGVRAFTQQPRPMERQPQQTTRVAMRLTTHPELGSITLHAPRRSGGCGRYPILPSPRSKCGPTGSASRAAVLSSTDESSVSTSDAPVATRVGLIGPARVTETAFPATSSKVTDPNGQERLPSTSCLLGRRTFARRPRTQTRHRSRDFAAPVRLPTLFRPSSRRRGARPCRFRALFAPGRSWPRAARRLLQPKRSASTTAAFETPL
jgi:hypothetical protein